MPYRLEEAPSARSGCQNKECKDQKIKIQNGELRHGTWIDTERFQSYMWRHWGCVTPKIISNIKESISEGDELNFDEIDGWDELAEENREKVRKALEQGHVDDEEWKGDIEMNRPGKMGFRVRGGKKKDAAEDKAEPKEQDEASKSKKRSAEAADAKGEDEEAPAKKAKKGGRGRKAAGAEEATSETEVKEKPAPAPKRGRAAKQKAAEKAAEQDEDDSAEEGEEEKPKRGRKAAAAKKGGADSAEKPNRGRKKAAPKPDN